MGDITKRETAHSFDYIQLVAWSIINAAFNWLSYYYRLYYAIAHE